jgi:hypothetical protein
LYRDLPSEAAARVLLRWRKGRGQLTSAL